MHEKNGLNYETKICLFGGSLIFIYLLIRAIYVPFTHDEASTFFHYVQTGKLIPDFSREALNNHFLNTLLTYLSYNIFGDTRLALRLPNLLSAIVYMIFVFKTAQYLKCKTYRWVFLITFCFSHFFIEFFGVSRGYGLSMAFFIAAFYFLLKAIKTNHLKNHVFVALFMVLMVAANLNLVIPSIAILIFQVLVISFQPEKMPKNQKWMIPLFLIISMVIIVTAFLYMNEVKMYDAFYYGTGGSFIEVTIKSLLRLLTGSDNIVILITVITFFVLVVAIAIWQFYTKKISFLISPNAVHLFVLLASITGIFLVVQLFGLHFPEDRVAIYLFPLFTGSLFFMFDSLNEKYNRYLGLILIPFLYFPVHFLISMNTSYVNGYKNEALPGKFYKTISDEHQKTGDKPTIGGANMRFFAWIYINYMNSGDQNMLDWKGYPDTVSLFQILESKNYPYKLDAYDSLDFAEYSGLTLFKRKNPIKNIKIAEILKHEPINIIEDLYYSLLTINADTVMDKQLFFKIDIDIHSDEEPFTAWLVLQINDEDKQTIIYKFVPFNWLKYRWNENSNPFSQSIFLGKLSEASDLIKIYIWNKDKKRYSINNYRIEVFETE